MRTRHIPHCLAFLALLCAASPAAARPAPSLSRELESALRQGAFREAEKAADRILAGGPADATSRALCGLALLKTGRLQEAESLFNDALATSPRHPEAHLGMGRISRIRNDNGKAIEHLLLATGSHVLRDEAFRQLWRAAREKGLVQELLEIRELAEHRYLSASESVPGWILNGVAQVEGYRDAVLYHMKGRFQRLSAPLVKKDGSSIRMVLLKLNGKGEYPFDIDSASPDFMTISPLLAEELGLKMAGSSSAVGVGSASARVRFSMVERVTLGDLVFEHVPVMVSDLATFRGAKKGLIGTGFLKRFNVTIDVAAGVMHLYPLERPDQLRESIRAEGVVAEVPLYIFEATTVEAVLEGGPPALYILDTAASTHLVDAAFLEEHLGPALKPGQITSSTITGSQGAHETRRIQGLTVSLGPLILPEQSAHEFKMDALNAIPGRYTAGLLGNPILWPYRVHMDFDAGRLILEKPTSQAGDGARRDPEG